MLQSIRRISLTKWILISMVVGILLGVFLPGVAVKLGPLSNIFLRMIKSLIAPLLFSTLVIGIAGHGDDMKKVGKLAFRSIIYFEIVTTLALFIGLFAVNLVKPGIGVSLQPPPGGAPALPGGEQPTFASVLEHIVPQSVVEAASKNEVLPIVFWSIIFAVALARVPVAPKKFMLSFCESLSETMFTASSPTTSASVVTISK